MDGQNKKGLHLTLGILASLLAVTAILLTSFEIAAYGDFGFYEKEYEKHQVLRDLDMEMKDVMYVTEEMMAYLKGEREILSVTTTIEGVEQDFFNEQDRIHMKDVQNLFLGGLLIRNICVAGAIICIVVLLCLRASLSWTLPRGYLVGLLVSGAMTAVIAYAFSRDFTAAFTKFHEIFFTNDLWIFDPAEDFMIRMLPEGFFADMVVRIGGIFLGTLFLLLFVSVVSIYLQKKKKNSL